MLIGSSHTMSYLKPHGFFDKLFGWLNRQQIEDIYVQYGIYGIRAFDLHIDFVGENNRAVFRNGNTTYETFSIFETLNFLNKKGNTYVRIVLEDRNNSIEKEKRFYDYCHSIEEIYKSIKFFGGYRETDKKSIYKFKYEFLGCNIKFFKRIDKLKY